MEITFYYLGTLDGRHVVVEGKRHAEIVPVDEVCYQNRRLIIHEKYGSANFALKRRVIKYLITNYDAWIQRREAAIMVEKRDLVVLPGTMKLALDNA